MTTFRADQVTLFCEDSESGLTKRLIGASLAELEKEPACAFAAVIRPEGSRSKSDVMVWTKFARQKKVRAFGLRDRDFLSSDLLKQGRESAFHESPESVKPWPLSRHCIESYLLDDDLIKSALPSVDVALFHARVDQAAEARFWWDVARATVEDLLFRRRNLPRPSVRERPVDRASALDAARSIATKIRREVAEADTDAVLEASFEKLERDMKDDGPLRHRVDGKELLKDISRILSADIPVRDLVATLQKKAMVQPPRALLDDVREALRAIPKAWRLE